MEEMRSRGVLVKELPAHDRRSHGIVPLAPIADRLCPELNRAAEASAFASLAQLLNNLLAFTREVIQANPGFLDRYSHHGGDNIIQAVLVVADGLVADVVEEAAIPEAHEELDEDLNEEWQVTPTEPDDAEMKAKEFMASREKQWLLDAYRDFAQGFVPALSLLPFLLQTVRDSTFGTAAQIIAFQRLLGYIFGRLYESFLDFKKHIVVQIMPHKARIVQGRIIRDCSEARHAQALAFASDAGEEQNELILYSYLGG